MNSYVNTGTAVVESDLLDKIEPGDRSLLEGAVTRGLDQHYHFGAYIWENWDHLLNPVDWQIVHYQKLRERKEPVSMHVGAAGLSDGPEPPVE